MPSDPSPAAWLRALKGAPASCLFALLLSDAPRSASWLAHSTGYSPNSITAALRLLEELALIQPDPRRRGWPPTPRARSLLNSHPPEPSDPPSAPASPDLANCDSGGIGGVLNSSPTSPPPPEDPQIARFDLPPPAVARILAATQTLLGERLHGAPGDYPNPRLLLASLADVYRRRHELRHPARVAFANLQRGVLPPDDCLADPLSFLPTNFLRLAGLPLPPPEPLEADPPSAPPEDAPTPDLDLSDSPDADDVPQLHPSLSLPASPQVSRTILEAWELALSDLRAAIHPSPALRRLEDLRPLRFDPAASLLEIGLPSQDDCLWFQQRLQTRLERLLFGYSNHSIRLSFLELKKSPSL